jgi:thiol-disulfide isomerase/thioredoxin
LTRSAGWTLAVVAAVAVIVAGFVAQLGQSPVREPGPDRSGLISTGRDHRDVDTPEALAEPRKLADLPPCPLGGDDAGPEALRGVTVECAADGAPVDLARAVAGRPVVLNLWAYWCGPCAEELPAMAEYQQRAGSGVTVLTVHQDENETAALLRLFELGVRLPTLQDGRRRIAAALGVPNVMPATVLLRSDGSVARILPRAFASADEIADAVGEDLR